MKIKAFALGLMLASLPGMAGAAVVYQSVPDLYDGSNVVAPYCSNCLGESFQSYGKFSLTSAETITGFSVSLYTEVPYWPADVTFSIWDVNGSDQPGTLRFTQTISSANFTTSGDIQAQLPSFIATTDDVAGLSLLAGDYYVSFYNSSALGVNAYYVDAGNFWQSGNDAPDDGFRPGQSLGFALLGPDAAPVPLPAAAWLLLSGLAGIGYFGRRRVAT